ncbi:MAG: MoaD/ThiS family protein [Candidatus Helarchaeota archaeon]
MSADKLVQKLELKKKKTLKQLIGELNLNNKYYAVLVDGRRVTNLTQVLEENSKIIILPKIQGG